MLDDKFEGEHCLEFHNYTAPMVKTHPDGSHHAPLTIFDNNTIVGLVGRKESPINIYFWSSMENV